ncbi:unnamed protein product [Brugia pahangi]|uniref:Uncharacterized protein n=1 Tax=Brugia pahangi TaxID=6280 RepID=A0A0N4THY8_BRUPA|nr:unnamed protein product [Brugia pahangi]
MNLPDEDPEEKKLNEEIAIWEEKLREIFGKSFIIQNQSESLFFQVVDKFVDKRIKDEKELSDYIEKRLIWFEQLRSHIAKVPLTDRTDMSRNVVREKVSLLIFVILKFVDLIL